MPLGGSFVLSLAQSLLGRLGSFLVRLANMCAWLLMRFQERFTGLDTKQASCPEAQSYVAKRKKASGFSYFLNERPRGKSYGNPLEMAALFLMAYTYSHLSREQVKSLQAKKNYSEVSFAFLAFKSTLLTTN